MTYPLSLHIFRRDLRLFDNTALNAALQSSKNVIPCFIFDKRQIENNIYKSQNSIQFMVESLRELENTIKSKNGKLFFFYGIAEEIVEKLLKQLPIRAVFLNRDYTPFSCIRDKKIENICNQFSVDFHAYADALLHEPEEILKKNQEPYTIFSHYFRAASSFIVSKPQNQNHDNYYKEDISFADKNILNTIVKNVNPSLLVKGGRNEALTLLKKLKNLQNYEEIRNFPALFGTTKLSAHNKFGTLSIRELYAEIIKLFGVNHTLIKELYWRDFFTHIAFHYPHVFGKAFHSKYDNINWSQNEKYFNAWCHGHTGFPIIDAGMRELNKTGYMHNRVRMLVASFLTKDLHIDWRWGEKYFAKKLVDYDPAVNNGNWQWAASTGCDAQPYFRIFNPWLQQKKFDSNAEYIKQWVPELNNVSPAIIHSLNTSQLKDYVTPIVDHSIESAKAKIMYKV